VIFLSSITSAVKVTERKTKTIMVFSIDGVFNAGLQAKLIPNLWLQVGVRAGIGAYIYLCSQLLSYSSLHPSLPFNSKFIIYDKVYEQGISMLSEVNTYPVQEGRRFNS